MSFQTILARLVSEGDIQIRFIVGDFELNFGDAMMSEDGGFPLKGEYAYRLLADYSTHQRERLFAPLSDSVNVEGRV